VKIYLLSIDNRRFFFYADESDASGEDCDGAGSSAATGTGRGRWIHGRLERLKAVWEHPESRVICWTHQVWDWLHSWAHPDESMLARLRSAHRIDLHHPAGRPAEQVRALWRAYLNHRWWRHLFWLGTNGLAAIPGMAILWVLPGPNVLGYWFAYRTVHHGLIVWGIRRVRRGRVPIELHPVGALDRPIERDPAGKARHDALDGSPALLDEHVAWSESEAPEPAPDPAQDRPAGAAPGPPGPGDPDQSRDA
jgi:hypothetical protein